MTGHEAGDRGRLVVISGPSGVGKGTVVRGLLQRRADLELSVSVTTRPPRPGEVDGVDYHFVDDPTFDAMIERGELLEWAHVHRHRSGTPRAGLEERLVKGRDVVLEIDVQGAMQVRDRVGDALLIFLAPPSEEELVRRLVRRGTERDDELAVRQADRARELAAATAFDHVVINDDLDDCVSQVAELVDGGR
ncbi:MAG: guanylate kinase [Actinomycetota bacterium]|nr:guanylate kinase [Actinomycetota bacterium]